tara:strand:- start:388 stop:537 length:150 start_codon:yes stop_codon:yes gene_type:complete
LDLYPRKERWILCGIMYITTISKKGAKMTWNKPIVPCNKKVKRPYLLKK